MADALIGIGVDLSEVVKAAGQLADTVEGDTEKALRQIQRMAIKSAKGIERANKQAAAEATRAARAGMRATELAAKMLFEAQQQVGSEADNARAALARELKELDKLAAKGADAAKVAKARAAIVIAGEKRIARAIENEAKAAARAQEEAAKKAAAAARAQTTEAREAAKGLAELAGISADRFDKIRAVMAGLSSPLGQVAIAGTAAALAVAGTAAALVGAGVAAVELTRKAGELVETLEPFNEVLRIRPQTIATIEAANTALDGAVVVGQKLVVQMAERIAPAVERTALLMVKLGLAASDTLDSMGGGAEAVGDIFGMMGRAVIGALSPSLKLLLDIVEVSKTVARATGLDSLADRLEGVQRKFRDLPLKAVELAFKGVEHATRDYDKAARDLLGVVKQVAEEEKKKEKNTRSSTQADKAAARQAAEAAKAFSIYQRALEAARAPFVDRSELAQLRRLQASLVASAAAAKLNVQQTAELASALSDIAVRINAIQAAQAGMFDPLTDELDRVSTQAAGALDQMASDVQASVENIPWRRVWASSLLESTQDAVSKARGILSTLTGGILGGFSIGALLEEAAKGRKGANALADSAIAFIEKLSKNIGPFIVAIVERAPEIGFAIAKGIVLGVVGLAKAIARAVRRAIREAVSFGRDRQDRRRRFSDTPGPIRVNRETTVTFAAGDRFAAARTDAGLRAQTGRGSGPGGSQQMEAVVVFDVRDGAARIGIERATARAVRRKGYGRNTTGRSRVF